MRNSILVKTQTSGIKAYLIMLISAALYAGNVICGKIVTQDMPALGLSALRGILGLMVILPLTWSTVKSAPRPTKNELIKLIALGFLGISFAYFSFLVAIKYTTATNVSIISAALPAVTNLFLVLGYKAKLQKRQINGIILSFLGLLIVFSKGSLWHLFTLKLGIGDLIMLSNVVSMGIFNVLSQSIMSKLSSVVTSVYALAFGTLLLIPAGVWQLTITSWHLSLTHWLIVIYMGGMVTGVAFFLYLYGISLIGSGRASMFNNLQPVISISLSIIILGETLTVYHIIGFLFVIIGIFLCLIKRREISKNVPQRPEPLDMV